MKKVHPNVHSGFGGKIQPGDISPYTILCGSKELAIRFAQCWDGFQVAADHYEFLVLSGEYKKNPLSICSTGVGPAPLAIAMEELANAGVRTVLFTGFSPALEERPAVAEDVVIVQGAVRWDGASQDYVRFEYPALAHFEVVQAAMSACESLGRTFRLSVTGNAELFPGSLNLADNPTSRTNREDRRLMMKQFNIDNGPAEIPMALVQSSLYGLRAGGILARGGEWEEEDAPAEAAAPLIEAALETMVTIRRWDAVKKEQHRKYMTPV